MFLWKMELLETYENKGDESGVKGEKVFRMFYADWCGHCQAAKPGFQDFMREYNEKVINGQKVKIEMVNADENEEMVKEYGVQGFPTFILSYGGQNYTYEGEREPKGYLDFIQGGK